MGGTSGIGAAIAKAFAAEGVKVTVTGATEPEVAALQEGADAKVLDVRDGFAGLSSPKDR